jgi:hypothetical protein
MFTPGAAECLEVRVQVIDGRDLHLQLLEVDLYTQQLVCKDSVGAHVHLPLASVTAVWQRRRLIHRSLSLWAGVLLAGALGAVLILGGEAPRNAVAAVALGGLVGALAGIGVLKMLDNWEVLYEWKSLYDRAAA